MVMHAMWMINDRNERDTCVCRKGEGSVVRSLGEDARKTLDVGRTHGRARMVATSRRKRMVANKISDVPFFPAVIDDRSFRKIF